MDSIADLVRQLFAQPAAQGANVGGGIRPQPYGRPVGWTPAEEAQFQPWMSAQAASSGTSADADHPLQSYDYRNAFRSGMQRGPEMHGASRFKTADHPNRFVYENGRWLDSMRDTPTSPMAISRQLLPRRPTLERYDPALLERRFRAGEGTRFNSDESETLYRHWNDRI